MRKILFLVILILIGIINESVGQIHYPGDDPGHAIVRILPGNRIILENNALRMELINDKGQLLLKSFENKSTREQLALNNAALFELILPDNIIVSSNEFTLVNPPVVSDIKPDPKSTTYANRLPGKKYSAILKNNRLGLDVNWEIHLRDGSNYVRQIFTFGSKDTFKISKINLIQIPINIGIRKEGTVDGVPLVYKNMFFAVENPLTKIEEIRKVEKSKINNDLVASLPLFRSVSKSNSYKCSSVWGITPPDQLRRGFNYYIERERAAPYHQMSFYNSWGDIAWSDRKMSERACLERIRWIGDSLINKRNVKLKAFLFDDGWDDNKTLWKFHAGFPNGFSTLKKEVESYGSTLGVWISPFGGYGIAKQQRLEYGKKQTPPFETNASGFSLAGPVYYERFKEVVIDFIKNYNITMLKFDGLAGNISNDVEAYLQVIMELREEKPDLYFCLTVGTYPSPFFLKYGDAVWRGGGDYGYTGEGSNRQRWITYRDADVYANVVQRSPLHPLNGLQRMGIFICDPSVFGQLGMDAKDISDDIWSAFATGTSVQGLYINANRMNTAAWDCVAEAINWAEANEPVMADVHWIGGDPSKGEVYGHAAWTPQKAVLSLRNPSAAEKTFEIITVREFELPPAHEKDEFQFFDAKTGNPKGNRQPVAQGRSFNITLQPFEVKVFDVLPKK